MLSDLIDSSKKELIDKLSSDFNYTNEQSEEIFSMTGKFLKENMEAQAAKNPKDILELINNESKTKKDNNVVNNLVSKLSNDISLKFELAHDKTEKTAEFLVLNIITKISEQLDNKDRKINLKDFLSFLGLGTELKESVKKSLEESSGKFSDYPKKLF
jgi:nucleoid DNA-binding protein